MTLHLYLNNKINVGKGLACNWLKASPNGKENVFDESLKWLEEAARLGFDRVRLSGGEATLEFEKLLAVIRKAKELKMWVSLKTNGWWANDETYWKELKKSGLDCLRISYDSDWFYKGSPLTKQISMKAIGDGRKLFDEFQVITDDSESDLAELEAIGVVIEVIPQSKMDMTYKFDITNTGFDPDIGKVVSRKHEPRKDFVIDFKGRVFTHSTGIFLAENNDVLDDRYIGDLRKESFEDLYKKYGTISRT